MSVVGKRGTLTLGGILFGAEVVVLRQSKITGSITVQFCQKTGAYQKGDTCVIMPYQFREEVMKP